MTPYIYLTNNEYVRVLRTICPTHMRGHTLTNAEMIQIDESLGLQFNDDSTSPLLRFQVINTRKFQTSVIRHGVTIHRQTCLS